MGSFDRWKSVDVYMYRRTAVRCNHVVSTTVLLNSFGTVAVTKLLQERKEYVVLPAIVGSLATEAPVYGEGSGGSLRQGNHHLLLVYGQAMMAGIERVLFRG